MCLVDNSKRKKILQRNKTIKSVMMIFQEMKGKI